MRTSQSIIRHSFGVSNRRVLAMFAISMLGAFIYFTVGSLTFGSDRLYRFPPKHAESQVAKAQLSVPQWKTDCGRGVPS
ncbi:hypothetical protein M407DRAFT_107684 [Tulasnella calospora MUT 4182]|uniref:Uncharacterized protein n=1 Tax=Tulasnella calospora MUT 4182 TaxID=1051891 RepID=A0A0C3LQF7_9AGAM|nr:hypothetical protein M407DRAFT_107684 [Tulasnella calospora MUT 4182]